MKRYFHLAFFIAYLLCIIGKQPISAIAQKPTQKETAIDKKALSPASKTQAKGNKKANNKAVKKTSTKNAATKNNKPSTSNTKVAASSITAKQAVISLAPAATPKTVAPAIAKIDSTAHTNQGSTFVDTTLLQPSTTANLNANTSNIGTAPTYYLNRINGILVLLPLFLGLLLSLWWGESLLALFLAIIVGAWALNGFNIDKLSTSFLQVFDTHIIQTLANPTHITFVLFMLLMGGVAALMRHNGAANGWAESLSSTIQSPRSAQLSAWFAALFSGFDPFVSAIFSGNIACPLHDKYRGSREKLAYIIHTTGTSIATLVIFSTFIGIIIPLIGNHVANWGNGSVSAVSVWLFALQYAFYPIFSLLWVFASILWQRDFGAMYRAEHRAQQQGKLYNSDIDLFANAHFVNQLPIATQRHTRGFYLLLPILAFVVVAFACIFQGAWHQNILSDDPATLFGRLLSAAQGANILLSLLWASVAALLLGITLTVLGGRLSIRHTIESLTLGMQTALPSVLTLLLSLTLLSICVHLKVGDYIAQHISGYHSLWLPFVAFLATAIASAALGSLSNAVLLILPILMPISMSQAYSGTLLPSTAAAIFYGTLANCVGGALFGAHISITAQSALVAAAAAQCPAIDHIRTQMPYAILIAFLGFIATALCIWLPIPVWIPLLGGIIIIPFLVRLLGNKITNNTLINEEIEGISEQQTTHNVAPIASNENPPTQDIITENTLNKKDLQAENEPIKPISAKPFIAENNIESNDMTTAVISNANPLPDKLPSPENVPEMPINDAINLISSANEAWQDDNVEETKSTETLMQTTDNQEIAQILTALENADLNNEEQIIAEISANEIIEEEESTSPYIIAEVNKDLHNQEAIVANNATLDQSIMDNNDNNAQNEENIHEAVSKTKDMFQSMKDIIASVSNDAPTADPLEANEEISAENNNTNKNEEQNILAQTEKKLLRYIKEDDDEESPIININNRNS